MGFASKLALVFGAVVFGYGAWWVWETMVVNPTKRLIEYNTGKRVYDPLEAVFDAPVESDEGFVCPGVILHAHGGVGDRYDMNRPVKVKVIKPFGEGYLLVKAFDGQGDINSPYQPDYWMDSKELKSREQLHSCSPTTPPSAARPSAQTPPSKETVPPSKAGADDPTPLPPPTQAEICGETTVFVYPPSENEAKFGSADLHDWTPERRRWAFVGERGNQVDVLETTNTDTKIRMTVRGTPLSGWVKNNQLGSPSCPVAGRP